ncbi:MAG: hypothetical protein K2L16_05665 [Muribaculaceae bacterium]|nr:hypothetical protein [Muribaculaceae bacterium]
MKHKKALSEIRETLTDEFNSLTQEKAEFYASRIKKSEGMDAPKEYQFKPSEVHRTRKKESKSTAFAVGASIAVPVIIFWAAMANLNMTAHSADSPTITDNTAFFCSKEPQTGMYGIQDSLGNWSARPKWSEVSPLGFGFFAAGDSIIDNRGTVLLSGASDISRSNSLGDKAIAFRAGFGNYGYVTRSGKLFAPEYDYIRYIGDGRIELNKNGHATIVDSEGNAANDSWSRSYRMLAGRETMFSIILTIASIIPFVLYFIEKRRLRKRQSAAT